IRTLRTVWTVGQPDRRVTHGQQPRPTQPGMDLLELFGVFGRVFRGFRQLTRSKSSHPVPLSPTPSTAICDRDAKIREIRRERGAWEAFPGQCCTQRWRNKNSRGRTSASVLGIVTGTREYWHRGNWTPDRTNVQDLLRLRRETWMKV